MVEKKTVAEMEARRKMLAAERQKRWRENNKVKQKHVQYRACARSFITRLANENDLKELIALCQTELNKRQIASLDTAKTAPAK